MTRALSYQIILLCHTDLSCHTETLHSKVKYLKILVILSETKCSEVSIKLGCVLNYMDISHSLNMTNDSKEIFRLFCKRLKMTKVVWIFC